MNFIFLALRWSCKNFRPFIQIYFSKARNITCRSAIKRTSTVTFMRIGLLFPFYIPLSFLSFSLSLSLPLSLSLFSWTDVRQARRAHLFCFPERFFLPIASAFNYEDKYVEIKSSDSRKFKGSTRTNFALFTRILLSISLSVSAV